MKKVTEKPLEFTHSIIEKSKKLRTPSPKADKIRTAVGGFVSIVILLGGGIQMFVGKPLWGGGTLAMGCVTLLSNRIHHHKIFKSKEI